MGEEEKLRVIERETEILLSGYAGILSGQLVDCREYPTAEKIDKEDIPKFLQK